MKEVRFFYAPEARHVQELPEEEARHALRVLRLSEGDDIVISDGKGYLYDARIVQTGKKNCQFEIMREEKWHKPWNGTLHLAMAPTKNADRTEWMAEKATEIGFDRLTLLDCAFSERRNVNIGRIEKIMVSAMKQSHKGLLPEVEGLVKFKDFLNRPFAGHKYIAHCYAEPELNVGGRPYLLDVLDGSDSLVMVGPEGDFSCEEVKMAVAAGFRPVSLGESRLRTETAALAAVHMMNIKNRKAHAEISSSL